MLLLVAEFGVASSVIVLRVVQVDLVVVLLLLGLVVVISCCCCFGDCCVCVCFSCSVSMYSRIVVIAFVIVAVVYDCRYSCW